MCLPTLFLLSLTLSTVKSHLNLQKQHPQQHDGLLASKRPILESNPSNGEARFPKHNPFTSNPETDSPSVAPPLPFSQMTPEAATYGISAVDTGNSFPLGSPANLESPYPMTASPPSGVPNENGVTIEQDEQVGDTSGPLWENSIPGP